MPAASKLREIFRLEAERTLGNDWVDRHENHFYQVLRASRSASNLARQREWKVSQCPIQESDEDGPSSNHQREQRVSRPPDGYR